VFELFKGLTEPEMGARASLSVGRRALTNRLSVLVRSSYIRDRWRHVAEEAAAASHDARFMRDLGLRERLRSYRGASTARTAMVAQMLGLVLEARTRTAGKIPTSAELIAAVAILDRGAVQLATPSARAISAGLAAVVGALLGRHVHVLAQDDDRAEVMAVTLRDTLEFLGIGFGVLRASLPPAVRRLQLAQPIVFAAVNQVAKDYLAAVTDSYFPTSPALHRIDALARGGLGPREAIDVVTDFAVVDAMDVLLCEGGTARLLAPAGVEDEPASALVEQAAGLADELHEGHDYSRGGGAVELTNAGEIRIGLIGRVFGPPWQSLPFNRQLKLVRRALDARALGDQDYRLVEGEIVPLTDAATAALRAEPDEHPSVEDFLAMRSGRSDRSRNAATRISICRFARKYRRLGGTIALSPYVAGELAGRFALACTTERKQTRMRLRMVDGPQEADRLLVSEVRSAVEHSASALVVVAPGGQVARAVQTLSAAGIGSMQLQGAVSESDADLVAGALRRPGTVVVVGPGREMAGMRELQAPNGLRPRLLVLGIESFGALPNALIGGLPPEEFERGALAIGSLNGDSRDLPLAGIEQRILRRLTASDGRISRRIGWLVLRSACTRTARHRGRARTAVYRYEDQQIGLLAFAGSTLRKL
jgi:hypothetical protein